MRKFILFAFLCLLSIETVNAQILHKSGSGRAEKVLSGRAVKRKNIKVKEPRVVLKAKKKQEAKERKLKKDYAKSIKKSQKRSIEIQSPEVQERMKQNRKNSALKSKMKKKKSRTSTKRAGKKYK